MSEWVPFVLVMVTGLLALWGLVIAGFILREIRRQGKGEDKSIGKPLVVEGKLVLWYRSGRDSWCIGDKWLDDIVASHFEIERVRTAWYRPIGRVRITIDMIERIDDGS